MKKVITLIIMLITLSAAQTPVKAIKVQTKTAPLWYDTTLTNVANATQFVDAVISNLGTDTIYVAKNKDTLYPMYIPVAPGFSQAIYQYMTMVRVKGRSAGQIYKVQIGVGQNVIPERTGTSSSPIYVTTVADSSTWGIWDSVRFTRPANVTAYSDSDVVRSGTSTGGSFLGFTLARRNGAFGYITQVTIATDTASTTNAIFDVLFFSDSTGMGATLPADNAGYRSSFENSKYYLGTATVALGMYGSNATGATGSWGTASNLLIPYQCAASSKKIYGLVVARAPYPPKYSGIFRLTANAQPTN